MPRSVFAIALCVQFSNEPTQYDPLLMEDGLSMRLAANTVGTLYEVDGEGKLQKRLVQDWKVAPDARQVRVTFKKGLKWSDGQPFHADHFILAIRRASASAVKSATSQFLPEFDIEKTRAVDAETAEVVMKQPDPLLAQWTTLTSMAPIRQDMIDSYQKRAQPVVPTLGDFMVADYKREDFLLLKKNPFGVHESKIKLDEVKIRFLKEESTLVSLLKQGIVDVLFRVPVLQQKEIEAVGRVVQTPVQAVTYFGINTRKPPFDKKENRVLLRDLWVKSWPKLVPALKTDEIAAVQFAPEVIWDRKKLNFLPKFGPGARAGAQAPLEFGVQTDISSRNQSILEFAQAELKKSGLGSMKIEVQEWKAHYAKIKSDPPQVFRFGWQNPVRHPYLTYQVLGSTSSNNFTGWKNEEFDRVLLKLRLEQNEVEQIKLSKKLEDLIWQEAPVIPVLHQVLKFGISKRVQGFRANSFGVVLFREIRLEN